MSRLVFTPWRKFLAFRDMGVTDAYLRRIAATAERIFKDGTNPPKSGRIYIRRGGRRHQASARTEYPARDTGSHFKTISSFSNSEEAVVGSGMYYAKFLRDGTRKMARRKMSDNALQEAQGKDFIGRFMRFRHV